MKDNYIIIVTYNAMKWIDRCLESIDSYDNIVIVDNNSSDNTVSYLKEKFLKITVISQSENLGFGAANNIGISYALNKGAKSVFLLNQDAYVIDDCLKNLIDFQCQNPEYGILSPIHIDASKTKLDFGFANYVSFNKNPNIVSDYMIQNEIKNVYEVPFVNAAAWLVSKKCLETVGGFDPLFFHYGEDDNYCQRVLFHQFKIGVYTKGFVIHDRALRRKEKIVLGSNQYFALKERAYKVRFSDVNNVNSIQELQLYINSIKKSILKNLILLKINQTRVLIKELFLLKRIAESIKNSYFKNKTKYKNYL